MTQTKTFLKKSFQTVLSKELAVNTFFDHWQDCFFNLDCCFFIELRVLFCKLLLVDCIYILVFDLFIFCFELLSKEWSDLVESTWRLLVLIFCQVINLDINRFNWLLLWRKQTNLFCNNGYLMFVDVNNFSEHFKNY
jgi:hypothetical protein